MIKYIKTAATEFEQFDGSQQLVDKYEILVGSTMFNGYVGEPSLCYMQTLGGNLRIHVGDWIATGVNGEHWAVTDEIFKQTYKELPVLPKELADLLAAYKHSGETLLQALSRATIAEPTRDWFFKLDLGLQINQEHYRKRQELFARAWLDGYEIDTES